MSEQKITRKKRTGLIRPSTKSFFSEGRQITGYSLFDWLHGYIYGRWIYFYIGMGTGQHPIAKKLGPLAARIAEIFRHLTSLFSSQKAITGNQAPKEEVVSFADTYHGKVISLESAKELVTIHEDIRLTNLEQVIPYALARDIVLQNPDHIVVLDCPCRSNRENPCLPLDVCLIVGEPFASFVVDHHPQKSRLISPSEAVNILEAEDRRGHVHHAFFKDAMLGRFYAICNCCSCCCGAIHAHQSGTPMLASSGYTAVINEVECAGCGNCENSCHFSALEMGANGIMHVTATCMGCGICVSNCNTGAISLERDMSKSAPLEMHSLIKQA